jgi:hypothetical protein
MIHAFAGSPSSPVPAPIPVGVREGAVFSARPILLTFLLRPFWRMIRRGRGKIVAAEDRRLISGVLSTVKKISSIHKTEEEIAK